MSKSTISISEQTGSLFLESFLGRSTVRTQIIYITVLVLIVTVLVALPFINVSLSVQGAGIIRPVSEKTEIKSLTTDIVEQVFVHEGQYVERGTPLIKFRTNNISSRIQFLQYQKKEIESYTSDLTQLVNSREEAPILRSALYQQEYSYALRQNEELQNKLQKATRDYNRNKELYESGVIAAMEFENITSQYSSAQNEIKITNNNQNSKWQADLTKYKSSLEEISSSLEQTKKEEDFYTVRAPISGNIEQFSGIYVGSTLRAGETVSVISPDSALISEIYVSPKDIGYLRQSSNVKIQVDAFNYNEWGILQGSIKSISSDFILVNNMPMFKVRCNLDKNYLSLQNGIKGVMKKGMTVRARFSIAERSLFQLLYQSADSWLNPTQYGATEN